MSQLASICARVLLWALAFWSTLFSPTARAELDFRPFIQADMGMGAKKDYFIRVKMNDDKSYKLTYKGSPAGKATTLSNISYEQLLYIFSVHKDDLPTDTEKPCENKTDDLSPESAYYIGDQPKSIYQNRKTTTISVLLSSVLTVVGECLTGQPFFAVAGLTALLTTKFYEELLNSHARYPFQRFVRTIGLERPNQICIPITLTVFEFTTIITNIRETYNK